MQAGRPRTSRRFSAIPSVTAFDPARSLRALTPTLPVCVALRLSLRDPFAAATNTVLLPMLFFMILNDPVCSSESFCRPPLLSGSQHPPAAKTVLAHSRKPPRCPSSCWSWAAVKQFWSSRATSSPFRLQTYPRFPRVVEQNGKDVRRGHAYKSLRREGRKVSDGTKRKCVVLVQGWREAGPEEGEGEGVQIILRSRLRSR